jgi:hypothetical protein
MKVDKKPIQMVQALNSTKSSYDFEDVDYSYLNIPMNDWNNRNILDIMFSNLSLTDSKTRFKFQESYTKNISKYLNLYRPYIIDELLKRFVVKNDYEDEEDEDDDFDEEREDYDNMNPVYTTEFSFENDYNGIATEVLDWFITNGLIFTDEELNRYDMDLTKEYIEQQQYNESKPLFK